MSAKVWVVRLTWAVWALVLVTAIFRVLLTAIFRPAQYPYQPSPLVAYLIVCLSVLVLVVVALPSFRTLLAAAAPASVLMHGLSGVVALGAILSIVAGFKWRFIGYGIEEPPASITDVMAPNQFDAVLAYAKTRIPYDSVTHGTADSAILTDTIGGSFYLVKAWIAPARDANFNSYGDFKGGGRGRGRVVARIRVDSVAIIAPAQRANYNSPGDLDRSSRSNGPVGLRGGLDTARGLGYKKLNLPAGVSYVWVDSLDVRDTTGTFRAVIIPDRPGGMAIRFPVSEYSKYYRSMHTIANFPMARWVLHNSNCTNVTCGNGCCQSCPS